MKPYLSPGGHEILDAIAAGHRTVAALADHTGRTVSNIHDAMRSLRARGYVVAHRGPPPTDGCAASLGRLAAPLRYAVTPAGSDILLARRVRGIEPGVPVKATQLRKAPATSHTCSKCGSETRW